MKFFGTQWLAVFLIVCLAACTKEVSKETHRSAGTPVSGEFYATIGSTQWNADSIQLIQVSNGGVSINGVSTTGEQISMILPSFKKGVYTLSAQTGSYALYANLLSATPVVYISNQGSGSGTVSITDIDTVNRQITGSFQLSLVDPADNSTKSITKGVFTAIPYSGGSGVVVITPPGTGDTVKATISGEGAFDATQVLTPVESGELTIAAFSSDGLRQIDLIMPATVQPGTYSLDFTAGNYAAAYTSETLDPFVSTQGSLVILANDATNKRIKGTFTFTGSSQSTSATVSVTSGYFSVGYQ